MVEYDSRPCMHSIEVATVNTSVFSCFLNRRQKLAQKIIYFCNEKLTQKPWHGYCFCECKMNRNRQCDSYLALCDYRRNKKGRFHRIPNFDKLPNTTWSLLTLNGALDSSMRGIGKENVYTYLQNLTYLDISNNNITFIVSQFISALKQIEVFKASCTKILTWPESFALMPMFVDPKKKKSHPWYYVAIEKHAGGYR